MSLTRARPSAGLSLCVAPVAAIGVDGVCCDDLPGVEVGDGDGVLVDEREDAFAAVGGPDALWATGRRERLRWRRDRLLDTTATFLDASFEVPTSTAREVLRDRGDMGAIEVTAQTAHRDAMIALTRIRLLGSKELVRLAEVVHRLDHDAYRLAQTLGGPSESVWSATGAQRRTAREALIDEFRGDLNPGDGGQIRL